jgi:hypothetical protein
MEPEKMSIPRQRLSKQISAATNTPVTIEELLVRCFLFGPCKMVIKKSSVENQFQVSG